MFSWDWALERLGGSRNYWISTTHRDGRPHALPVWGVVVDGTLYFGTSDTSAKGRNLARSPEVVAHTESGDKTVILEGVVETVAVTEEIAAAYDSRYDWRPEPGERYLAVRPRRAYAWRERDYPTSATRFDF
jgi:pyridoxine/pyridoxamine 5'-phosphate oxidase